MKKKEEINANTPKLFCSCSFTACALIVTDLSHKMWLLQDCVFFFYLNCPSTHLHGGNYDLSIFKWLLHLHLKCLPFANPSLVIYNFYLFMFQEHGSCTAASSPTDLRHAIRARSDAAREVKCPGRRSCRATGPLLKALPLLWSGRYESHRDHGHERDQSLGRTRLDGDGERRARHHAQWQTQNLGGKSAEDEKRLARKRNVGWKIWLSSLLCRIRHRTWKCLEISLFMRKERRR